MKGMHKGAESGANVFLLEVWQLLFRREGGHALASQAEAHLTH